MLSPSFSSVFPTLFWASLPHSLLLSPPHSFLLSSRFFSVSPSFVWSSLPHSLLSLPLILFFSLPDSLLSLPHSFGLLSYVLLYLSYSVSHLFASLSLHHYHLPLPHSFLFLIVFSFSHSPILSQYHFSYRSFFSFRYWLLSPSIPLCLAHVNLSISLTLVSAPSSYSLFSRILDGR